MHLHRIMHFQCKTSRHPPQESRAWERRETPEVEQWKKDTCWAGMLGPLKGWWENIEKRCVRYTHTHTHTGMSICWWHKIQSKTHQAHDSRLKEMPMFLLRSKQVPLMQTFDLQRFYEAHPHWRASQVAQMVKNLPATQETWVWSLGGEDPLEKEMATHSSILAWRIPWTEEPGGLQSMGSQRVGLDWVTDTFTLTHIGEDHLFNSGYWLKGVSLPETLTDTSRILFGQMSEHPPAQLTHKINHHRSISVE